MPFTLDPSFIVFDAPLKTYAPGDVVSGKVSFTSNQQVAARYLRVEWVGEMTTRIPEVASVSSLQFFAQSKVIWQAKRCNNVLPAGNYTYAFTFTLPSTCEPTFSGRFGMTEYYVQLVMDRPWKGIEEAKAPFIVAKTFDIRERAPQMLLGARFNNFRVSGSVFKDGQFSMKVRMPTRAYLPGETITATVEIDNNSSKAIRCVKAKLIQQSHYHHRPQKHSCTSAETRTCPLADRYRKDAEREVKKGEWKCDIAPFTKKTVEVQVDLPHSIQPIFENSMMSIGYLMSFSAKTTSLTGNKLSCNCRIVVGTSNTPKPLGEVPPPPYDPKWMDGKKV